MYINVMTTSADSNNAIPSSKIVDISKTGNAKWLTSHIKWAASNNRIVYIYPNDGPELQIYPAAEF